MYQENTFDHTNKKINSFHVMIMIEIHIIAQALFLVITLMIVLHGMRMIFSPYCQLIFITMTFVSYGCCVYISTEYPIIAWLMYNILMYTCLETSVGNYTTYKLVRSYFGRDFSVQYKRLKDNHIEQVANIDAFEKLPHECFGTRPIGNEMVQLYVVNDIPQKYLDKNGYLKDCYVIDDAYTMCMNDGLIPYDKLKDIPSLFNNRGMYNTLHAIMKSYFEIQDFAIYSTDAHLEYSLNSKLNHINTIRIHDNTHMTYLINGEVKPGDALHTYYGFSHFLLHLLPMITPRTLIGYYAFLCDYMRIKATHNWNTRSDQDVLFIIYEQFLKLYQAKKIEICPYPNPYAIKHDLEYHDNMQTSTNITDEMMLAIKQEIPVLKRTSLN
jgi:hypothetical protein